MCSFQGSHRQSLSDRGSESQNRRVLEQDKGYPKGFRWLDQGLHEESEWEEIGNSRTEDLDREAC